MPKLNQFDQYFTQPETAKMCWGYLHQLKGLPLHEFSQYLEPSVGEGAFFLLMPESRRLGVELAPPVNCCHPSVIEADFLDFTPEQSNLVTVGNPPFGRNSSTAIKFFNHAAKFSCLIAFILPRSFKKVSIQSKLSSDFHLIGQFDLPPSSFLMEGQPYDVPCCFQVWEKKEIRRAPYIPLNACTDFSFVTPDLADVAIRRVGRQAGKVRRDFAGFSKTSHFFIKYHKEDKTVLDILTNLDFTQIKQQTAGPFSVSKHEIITEYLNFKKS